MKGVFPSSGIQPSRRGPTARTRIIKKESETALFEKGGEISQESA